MNLGYSISWLGQPFPPFTSEDVALLPFQPISTTPYSSTTETWSTISDVYSTDLDCTTAYVKYKPNGYTFSNGRGCFVPDIALELNQRVPCIVHWALLKCRLRLVSTGPELYRRAF
jgi:hypothetical protein